MLMGSSDLLWDKKKAAVWGVHPLQEFCVSIPTEHTDGCALGDKDTTTAASEVGAGPLQHLLRERRSQSLPRVQSGDKHPTARMGCPDCAGRHFPRCPHTSPPCTSLAPSQVPSKEVGQLSLSTSAHPTPPAPSGVHTGRKRCASDNSFPVLSPQI